MSESERLTELETRVAFQESALDTLSDVIARQELELEKLNRMVKHLALQLKGLSLAEGDGMADEPPPPHY
ncbi:SlyX family protein [Nitrincola tapanii]|uniref:Protein SlyX homolog n=1 Tax=Nitrincola tapanii TaxID=1708751 RepID=A0A5A9VZA8_9GAMM|nr:SlyX family protein [Nitrincola tapanii]KAA0873860.1 SlyX family protein [Nitrincola tapanii]